MYLYYKRGYVLDYCLELYVFFGCVIFSDCKYVNNFLGGKGGYIAKYD